MGIGIVLLFWGVVGLIGAVISSFVLYWIALDFTHGKITQTRRLSWAVRLFPFACLAWAGGVFVFSAIVNEVYFHRDPGIGDAWECPLPNGYALLMIDVTDRATLYNPRTQHSSGVISQRDTADACLLQLAGIYMLGGSGCGNRNDRASSYFLLDTTRGTRVNVPTYEALVQAAAAKSLQVHLEPVYEIYRRYRFTWFDIAIATAFFGVPVWCASSLLRSLWRIRKSDPATA